MITPRVRTDVTKIELRTRGKWIAPAKRSASVVGRGEFVFLNERGSLSEHGWDGSEKGKLWRYNQHYFDDLNAEQAVNRVEWHRELLNDWISNNPPFKGNGWDPYPTSLRLVNWIKWALSGVELPAGRCRHCGDRLRPPRNECRSPRHGSGEEPEVLDLPGKLHAVWFWSLFWVRHSRSSRRSLALSARLCRGSMLLGGRTPEPILAVTIPDTPPTPLPIGSLCRTWPSPTSVKSVLKTVTIHDSGSERVIFSPEPPEG